MPSAGVALIVEVATDNRNRAAADLRLILTKNHGNLATPGAVSYMFHRKGRITVPVAAIAEERLLEAGDRKPEAEECEFDGRGVSRRLPRLPTIFMPSAEVLRKPSGVPS